MSESASKFDASSEGKVGRPSDAGDAGRSDVGNGREVGPGETNAMIPIDPTLSSATPRQEGKEGSSGGKVGSVESKTGSVEGSSAREDSSEEGTAVELSPEHGLEGEELGGGASSVECGRGKAVNSSPEHGLKGEETGGVAPSSGWQDEGHVCGVPPVGCRAEPAELVSG